MKKDTTHFTIGGKDYPIAPSFEVQYYSTVNYPQEKLEGRSLKEAYDYTLDMTMQLLADPKPFATVEELRKALSPREYRAIDDSIAYIIFDMEDPQEEDAKATKGKSVK